MIVEQWNILWWNSERYDVRTVEQRWWNSGTSDGGTVEQRWWNSVTVVVKKWYTDGGTLEHLMVGQ